MKRKLEFCTQTAVAALLLGASSAAMAAPSDGLETVVVTATKRATNLESTPIAVTALDTRTLREHNVQTVADIAHLVPSLQATTQGDHGVITLTLRGQAQDSGALGDTINVLNAESKRVVQAVVTGPDRVSVGAITTRVVDNMIVQPQQSQ